MTRRRAAPGRKAIDGDVLAERVLKLAQLALRLSDRQPSAHTSTAHHWRGYARAMLFVHKMAPYWQRSARLARRRRGRGR